MTKVMFHYLADSDLSESSSDVLVTLCVCNKVEEDFSATLVVISTSGKCRINKARMHPQYSVYI